MVICSTEDGRALAKAIEAHNLSVGVLVYFVYRKAFDSFIATAGYRKIWKYLILDCGAFTAHYSGETISLDDYCKWLEIMIPKFEPDEYAALDVINDPAASLKNAESMWQRGLKAAFPTYHIGEGEYWLKRIAGAHHKVGIGGIARIIQQKKRRAMFDWTMQRCPDNLFHAWGCVNKELVLDFPFHTCDASSWMSPMMYGRSMAFGRMSPRDKDTRLAAIDREILYYQELQDLAQSRWSKHWQQKELVK